MNRNVIQEYNRVSDEIYKLIGETIYNPRNVSEVKEQKEKALQILSMAQEMVKICS